MKTFKITITTEHKETEKRIDYYLILHAEGWLMDTLDIGKEYFENRFSGIVERERIIDVRAELLQQEINYIGFRSY